MWSVCKLIENDFADLNSPQYLVYKNHFNNKNESYVTNTKYNIIFAHEYFYKLDEVKPEQFDAIKAKFDRRIERFKEALASGKQILFFRVERDLPGLINFPEDGITEPELFYVQKFSQLMRDKGIKCNIVFFTSSNPTAWDPVNKICSIHIDLPSKQFLSDRELLDVLTTNREFVKASLQ